MRQLFLLLLTVLGSVSLAWADDRSKLIEHLSHTQALDAHFSQKMFDDRGKRLASSEGELKLKRPHQFLWDVQKPEKQLVLADGLKLWVYEPELKQATVHAQKQSLANTPAALLLDLGSASNSYTVREQKSDKGLRIFQLRAKSKDHHFQTVTLRFKEHMLVSMSLTDHLAQRSEIVFTQQKHNPILRSDLFQFTPPRGVDVVDASNHTD